MIFDVTPSIVNFCSQFLPNLGGFAPAHVASMLPILLAAMTSMERGRYSLTSLARQVYGHECHKSTLSRLLSCADFRSRDLHWAILPLVFRLLSAATCGPIVWLVAIDGTSLQRGADTLIKGAIHPDRRQVGKQRRRAGKSTRGGKRVRIAKELKKRKAAKKGRRTKYFTLLLGSLTTHLGVRIPLPRFTCDPKDFHRRSGRPKKKRDTQLDLAKLMLDKLLCILPDNVKLVVVADAYFESEKLIGHAKNRNFVFITPIDSNRCFARKDDPKKSNRRRIRNHGLRLPMSAFSRLDLVRGSEETASYRRYSKRLPGPKDRRTYWLNHEKRTVAGLGEVGIVYSWKTPVYEPRRNFRKKSFKILVCSDSSWSAEKVVEWYEMRWTAIEILIRELKQELGFNDYTGLSLEAMERYVDIVLISFLYLELNRFSIVDNPAARKSDRDFATTARTAGMKALVRAEADRQFQVAIRQADRSAYARRKVMGFVSRRTTLQSFTHP